MGRVAERRRGLPRVSRPRRRPLVHRRDCGLKERMMTIAELLLPEVDQEMATTRRVLERVPDDKLGWTPHEKSWSMGALASHVANLIKWADVTMNATEFDMADVPPGQMNQEAT